MVGQWTHHMLHVVHCGILGQRSRGWTSSPVLSRLWRIEEYLWKRIRRKPVDAPKCKSPEHHRLECECAVDSHELAVLKQRVRELEAALQPFAFEDFSDEIADNEIAFGGPMVRVGDYRRLTALLKPKETADEQPT